MTARPVADRRLTVAMTDLLSEIRKSPGMSVGGRYYRNELRTARALERRKLIELIPVSPEGYRAYAVKESA